MRHPLIATLAFVLFQAVTATLFLRPAEFIEWLADLPIYEGLILSTLVLAATSMEPHFHWRALLRQPITLCTTGMLLAIVLSHLTHFYLGGVIDSGTEFLKTLIYYGLTITVVNSPARFRLYLGNIAFCCGLMVTLCLLDYWNILDFEFIVHLQDLDGHDDEGNPIWFQRMRGTGIFMDPNDLAMVIIAGGCLCLYFLTDVSLGVWRYFWAFPIAVFAVAILETKSRGGLMAGAVAVMTMASLRYGTKVTVMIAVLGVCMLPVVAGRSAQIEVGDGSTSHERMLMWREGFDALKSPELFFGIGHNSYADLAGLVAHNSFIHTYVELGIIGGTVFFGCFFFVGLQIYRMGRLDEPCWHSELVRMRPYIAGVVAGWCMSMFSLSRCYVTPTYLILGMSAAYMNLVWIHTPVGRPLVRFDVREFARLTVASAGTFISLYVFTMLMT